MFASLHLLTSLRTTLHSHPCSAFYIGYTLTNLVGGYLASSWSAKSVLGAGVVIWSIFTITTPMAASTTLPVLLGNRALMGAGEGVTFPCVQNIVKFWCPADVRSRALALIYSGGQLGTIVALVTAPLIIQVCWWLHVVLTKGFTAARVSIPSHGKTCMINRAGCLSEYCSTC
jgi:MFS family permease